MTVDVPLELLDVSPDQNRTVFDPDKLLALGEALKVRQLVPIIVRRSGARYILVGGERRTRAARLVGLTHLRAEVVELDGLEARLATLGENAGREDPDPIDQARGFSSAIDAGATLEDVARAAVVRVSTVRARLALLELDDLAQARVRAGDLKLTYASAMVGLDGNRQLLALHAYAHVPTPPIDAFRTQCDRWRDDQAAEGMSLLDGDAFMVVDEWVREVETANTPVVLEPAELVGVREIAVLLEVKAATVHQWQARALFPPPAGKVSGTPFWTSETVLEWARETDRLPKNLVGAPIPS